MEGDKKDKGDYITARAFINYLSVISGIVLAFGIIYLVIVLTIYNEYNPIDFEFAKQILIAAFAICSSIATLIYTNVRWSKNKENSSDDTS